MSLFRCSIALLTLNAVAFGADSPAADGIRFFETDVRPLLSKHCYKCHGEKQQESSLRLDTFTGLMAGGDAGPSIVVGQPDASLLIHAARYTDENLQMPPDYRLSKQDVASLERWIKLGAPHPDASGGLPGAHPRIDLKAARQFWSFQPPTRHSPPASDNREWARKPMDKFVQAKLDEHGLKPAPQADRLTLIRRATLALIGLPPTPAAVDQFIADDRPDALSCLTDRLLASPHYGERWGRHWLDIARYADSNGLDENIHHGNAWRYRDYVVTAFNSDKSFAQFVREQIAGDLLETNAVDQRHERLIATGFLSIGPKVLAEVDETKMEMDIIDEQVDTVGRAFMGMTIGCARCHDHKFDPISAKDYYALAGILKSTKVMEHYTKIARWWENPIPTAADELRQKEYDAQLAAAEEAVKQRQAQAEANVRQSLRAGSSDPVDVKKHFDQKTTDELKQLADRLAALKQKPPVMPTAMGVREREPFDLKVHIRGSHLSLGEQVARGFPTLFVSNQAQPTGNQSGRRQLADWLVSDDHPLTARVITNRVWRWHFGEGLVSTPDNFGNLGSRPVNQPLLDDLAVQLREHNWSLKWLHREIVGSSTWQMDSRIDSNSPDLAVAQRIDPENRFLWRANLRRLEAECVRDSILATSGQLDLMMGGTLITIDNRKFFFDHTSRDLTDYSSTRRSLYLPVVRNHLCEIFSLFDYTDAGSVTGDRTSSTVAPQALFMMNSRFVLDAARRIAESANSTGSENESRIRFLYRTILTRQPTAAELSQATEFVAQVSKSGDDHHQPWRLLAQTLLSTNEFIYVR